MSHLHIPDGIIPPIWILIGLSVAAFFIAIALYHLRGADLREFVPKAGIVGAAMLVGMTVPLPFLGYHLNLSVLAGIILGPAAALISVFAVNLILALIGHSGITVLGLNALIMGAEASVGFIIFRNLKKIISIKKAAFLATLTALIVSTLLMISSVFLVGLNPVETLHFKEEEEIHQTEDHGGESREEALTAFAMTIVAFASIGWIIESFLISEVVSFISKMRPDLIKGGEE